MNRLRPRKMKKEPSKQDSGFDDGVSSSSEREEMSSSDDEEDWFVNGKTQTRNKNKPKVTKAEPVLEEEPVISEYEKIRLQNIEERNQLLKRMGISNQEDEPKPLPAKRQKKEKENLVPRRMSLRAKKLPAFMDSSFVDEVANNEFVIESDTRNLGKEKWSENEMQGKEEFLEELKSKLNVNGCYSDNLNLSSCSQESFQNVMLSLIVEKTPKVVQSRVQSLCVHPITSKRIVLAGSTSGSLGIWDVDGSDESFVELYPCGRPINCLTVDLFDSNKIYLTSHEGTFKSADIQTNQFDNMYATTFEDMTRHLTWHDQIDANVFLISHGNGNVLTVDKRENKVSQIIECFQRSARTVHHHPSQNDYFISASGAHGCGIFDIRNKKEVSHLNHTKGLTSAFFSPSGNRIITTCNDDTVQVWNSEDLNNVTSKVIISHNNHTGQWLSVFKAKWYPGRDDIFHIGSLMNPRRIQMYTAEGELLTVLSHEEMSTIQSVICAHPCLPFIVGGNSTGKLHAFIPAK